MSDPWSVLIYIYEIKPYSFCAILTKFRSVELNLISFKAEIKQAQLSILILINFEMTVR